MPGNRTQGSQAAPGHVQPLLQSRRGIIPALLAAPVLPALLTEGQPLRAVLEFILDPEQSIVSSQDCVTTSVDFSEWWVDLQA